MLETIILLAIFTTLVVVGVHSVTRNDKLLWFLGVRIHARDKALDLQDQMTERLDAAFSDYENVLGQIYLEVQNFAEQKDGEGYCPNPSDVTKFKEQKLNKVAENYEAVRQLISSNFEQRITALQKRAEILERNRLIKTLLFFAPALTECLTCMASFWGTLIFSLYFSGVLSMSFFFVPIAMPFFLLSVAGLNTAIGKIIA